MEGSTVTWCRRDQGAQGWTENQGMGSRSLRAEGGRWVKQQKYTFEETGDKKLE